MTIDRPFHSDLAFCAKHFRNAERHFDKGSATTRLDDPSSEALPTRHPSG
jgi:hypothetical protein